MLLQAYLTRLNSIPLLAGKVEIGLPAQFESVASSPHGWITSVLEVAGESPVTGPVRQSVELRLGVSVGARDMASMIQARDAIKTSMLGFTPDPEYAPMEFRMGQMEFSDPGWWFWRDEFMTRYYLT